MRRERSVLQVAAARLESLAYVVRRSTLCCADVPLSCAAAIIEA
jgi:hypothetical protein